MDYRLYRIACDGDINGLYDEICTDHRVLDGIDEIPFIETPLHVAASRGHINFAVEIMRLKPSFSKKLNQQGWSPMHLALQEKQIWTVLRFLETEHGPDLVRVKGREGVTPLHHVVELGHLELLPEFLSVNPRSIIDTTNQGETALHIAARKRNIEALDALLAFLRRSWKGEELFWEEKVLNWKDEKGYTVLHVVAIMNEIQMVKLLLKGDIHVNAISLSGLTALDIVTKLESEDSVKMRDLLTKPGDSYDYTEMKNLLTGAGALDGHSIQINDKDTTSTKQFSFKSGLTPLEKVIRFINGQKTNISTESRDALLVVAALVATATFQAVLSPPGGLRQADSNSNSLPSGNAGKVVMREWLYIIFLVLNGTSFWVTIITIFLLLPHGFYGRLLTLPLALLSASYLFSSTVISPSLTCSVINLGLFTLFIILLLLSLVLLSNRQWFRSIRKLFTRSNT